MIRLCTGISKMTPAWKSIFQQIGVNAEEIDFSSSISTKYSSLIINSSLNEDEKKKVHRFVNNDLGGVVFSNNTDSLFKTERSTTKLELELPFEYANSINSYYLGSGLIFTLDFDPGKEFSSIEYERKRFSYKTNYHPDEIVSKVDRTALINTIETLLKELHYVSRIPFVSKWHSPTKKPFFAFRVDTDFGTQESIQNLYELANAFEVPMTWFLHVQAHEEWLNFFHSFDKQEIALHGYEHGTSTSYEHIINNIERGKQLMVDAGLSTDGFCVPYSIWNETLGDVINQFDFKYSSEFTLGYDTVPFFPVHRNELHSTLQIPIHPICTGSLNRKKATVKEMEEYFEAILHQKSEMMENVIFYHHPLQPGLEIWKKIFRQVNDLEMTKLTFSEIADFWIKRLNSTLELYFDEESQALNCNSSNAELILNVSTNSKEFYLIEASKVNRPLNSFESIESLRIQSLSTDTRKELVSDRLQLLKTSILDWKNRRKL